MNIDVQKLLEVTADELSEAINSITERIATDGGENQPSINSDLRAITGHMTELCGQYAKCLAMVPDILQGHDDIEKLEKKVERRMEFMNGNTTTMYDGQKILDNLIVQVGEKVRRTRISEANRVYSEDVHRYAHFISKDHTASAPDWWQPTDGTKMDRGFPSKETMDRGHLGRAMREYQDRQRDQDPARFRHQQMLLHQQRQVTRVSENSARAELGLPSKEDEESAREASLGQSSLLTDDVASNSMKALRSQTSVQSPGGDIGRQRTGTNSVGLARASLSQPPSRTGTTHKTSSPRGGRSGSRANRVDSPLTSPNALGVGLAKPPSQLQTQRSGVSTSVIASTRMGGPVGTTVPVDQSPVVVPMDVEIPHVGEVEHMTSDSSSSFSSGDETSK